MRCSDLDRILDERLYSSLQGVERSAVAEHLQACRRCSAVWEVDATLQGEDPGRPPVESFGAMLTALDDSGRAAVLPVFRPTGPGSRVTALTGIAATAAIALIGLLQAPAGIRSDAGADRGAAATAAQRGPELSITAAQHYRRLDPATSSAPADRFADPDVIEVEEFFLYACPHCYTFEGLFDPWCEQQPEYVRITRVPVVFNAAARLHARSFFAADALGVGAPMHTALLDAIHEDGQPMDSAQALGALAMQHGIDPETFVAALDAPRVVNAVAAAESLAAYYGIDAAPAIVVDGTWHVEPDSDTSFADMLNTARMLVDATREARCEDRDRARPAYC